MLEKSKFFKFGSGALNNPLIDIVITSITDATRYSDDFTEIVCAENSNITVTGTVAIPDRAFAMAMQRDNGELTIFDVEIVNGAFSVVLNFPSSGQYVFNNALANRDLPNAVFNINPITVDVVRAL